jgi:hypothetical protein
MVSKGYNNRRNSKPDNIQKNNILADQSFLDGEEKIL